MKRLLLAGVCGLLFSVAAGIAFGDSTPTAEQQCKAEQSDPGFAAAHGGKTFLQFYGENINQANAYGKCVSDAQAATPAPAPPGTYTFDVSGGNNPDTPLVWDYATGKPGEGTGTGTQVGFVGSYPLNATATDGAGDSGPVTGVCSQDENGHFTEVTVLAGGNLTSTTTGQDDRTNTCTFHMDFGHVGTLDGSAVVSNHEDASDSGVKYDSSIDMTVVAGTGKFAGLIGSGTTSDSSSAGPLVSTMQSTGSSTGSNSTTYTGTTPHTTTPTSTTTGPTTTTGSTTTTGPTTTTGQTTTSTTTSTTSTSTTTTTKGRRLAAASPKSKGKAHPWRAILHRGKPGIAIALPGAKLTAKTDGGLRIEALPATKCTATATGGSKRVAIGTATTDKNGYAQIVAKLRPLLRTGRWTLSVACGAATSTSMVSVS